MKSLSANWGDKGIGEIFGSVNPLMRHTVEKAQPKGKGKIPTFEEKLCWIDTIAPEQASGYLAEIYRAVASPRGNVDHLYQAQSLMPETLIAQDALYKSILHGASNVLPGWFSEAVGVYTSLLNGCEYAAVHHGANMAHLLNDAERSAAIITAFKKDTPESAFTGNNLKLLQYARRLVKLPGGITRNPVESLRRAGIRDREILEVNQVVALFSYFNRVISGLGISFGREKIGLYGDGKTQGKGLPYIDK